MENFLLFYVLFKAVVLWGLLGGIAVQCVAYYNVGSAGWAWPLAWLAVTEVSWQLTTHLSPPHPHEVKTQSVTQFTVLEPTMMRDFEEMWHKMTVIRWSGTIVIRKVIDTMRLFNFGAFS